MDQDQLAAFDHVVREGGFTRAAIALGIGQPAVSARIRALEDEVGGTLFTRGRRVALTALGESFLPFARRALEVLGEGVEAARMAQVGRRGRIRLGALASLAGGLVGPALSAFVRAHPDVEWVVRAGDHERIVALLLDGMVELGLVTWPCTEAVAADLQAILLFHEPVVLVAHPGHALARRSRVSQDDLVRLGRPLFRLRWWQTHHPAILRLAERAGPAVELPMETARCLAMDGAGVGFFARTYIAEDLARGALVEIAVRDLPRIHRDSALVRRRRSGPLSPAGANLVEAIRRQAENLGLLTAQARRGRGERARPVT
ncbi:MAG TPA: LysR family transcriptional regulator [Anaeromyxobacter sp.]